MTEGIAWMRLYGMRALVTYVSRLPRGVLVLALLALIGTTFVACAAEDRVFGTEEDSAANDSSSVDDSAASSDAVDDTPSTNH